MSQYLVKAPGYNTSYRITAPSPTAAARRWCDIVPRVVALKCASKQGQILEVVNTDGQATRYRAYAEPSFLWQLREEG